jgi:caffeoyl-CoA O-methyltransferase
MLQSAEFMAKSTGIDAAIYEYLDRHRTPDDALLEELRNETWARFPRLAGMQISGLQGTLLRQLVQLMGARRAVEVGSFTGYSAIEIARGLVPGGTLLACDVSEEWTSLARQYWAKAGLSDRIELRLGPAAETLRALPEREPIDFAFIDADKSNYATYYEEILRRLRPNGLIALDNTLWGGSVLDASDQRENTDAIRRINVQVASDPRVECVLLPVADGLMLARKRA